MTILNHSAFSNEGMTKSINLIENKFGRIKDLKLYKVKKKDTTIYKLGMNGGVVRMINNQPRGATGNYIAPPKGRMINFSPTYIPQSSTIQPDEVQNIIEWLKNGQLKSIASVVNDHLKIIEGNFAITEEAYRWGGISGKIMNADGSIFDDLFDAFGLTEKEIFFDLTVDAEVESKITQLQHHMEDNLMGETMDGIYGFCSTEFFDALITTNECKKVFADYTRLNPDRHKKFQRQFEYKGVLFIECRDRGSYVLPDGTILTRQFVPDGDCRFVPAGMQDGFVNWFAPTPRLDAVNKIAKRLYVSKKILDHNAGIELKADSAPGYLATRPNVLVRGNVGDGL